MEKYSHYSVYKSGLIKKKTLQQHIEGMLQTLLGKNFPHSTELKYQSFLYDIIKLHDFGKFTSFFQKYLIEKETSNSNHFHALIGALVAFEKYKCDPKSALIAYFLIYCHHKPLLPSISNIYYEETDGRYNVTRKRLMNQIDDLFPLWEEIQKELSIKLDFSLIIIKQINLFGEIEKLIDDSDIHNYFQINYLFSLLIEADKLDASDTPVYKRRALLANKVDIDKGIPKEKWDNTKSDFGDLTQNQLRNLVRKCVVDRLDEENILEEKLFTLTGPTGIGKTLTALDFALKLREKIRLEKDYEPQIIYALPFINIIEQSDSVYRKLFENSEAKILSHYQYADALSRQKQEDEHNEGKDYNKKLMALDTWQCDIVITTFVQFLQTLIGNRNKLLKKFNHYAGSIIILDEVQTIALKQLPLVGASLFYLAKFLEARIVLMTATKPKVFELANEKILIEEDELAKPMELLGSEEDVSKIFRSFKRTKLVPLIKEPINNQDDFIENYFQQKWEQNKSCLVVVNTVKLSIDIYNSATKYVNDNGIKNPVYYLSTNIVPAHRQSIIDKIKVDIQKAKMGKGLKPILISTQCVEAGVDLDFDMAFRDLAPIDSIVQVAGRVNRENNKNYRGTIYIVDFGKCATIYGPLTESTARNAISEKDEILEEDYLDLISFYYQNIIEKNNDGFSFSTNFFKSMKELNYDGDDYSVSKFQVIENGFRTSSVFIETDEIATSAKEAFERMVNKEIGREQFEKYKKDFHQHIIAVPDYLDKVQELIAMESEITKDILCVPVELVNEYYNRVTGFIRDKVEESWGTIL